MNKHSLLQKIFGLLAVVLSLFVFVISCGGDPGDSPGTTPGTTPDPGPTPAPKGISITPPSPIYIGLDTTNILTVNFTGFTDEEDRTLTLSNGDPAVISLPPYTNENNTNKDKTNFQVIAFALRNAEDSIISARVGEFTAIAVVRVVVGLSQITLSRTSITLAAGTTATIVPQTFPLDADYTNLTWTSGNPAVATVDNGKVTGVSEGTTTITASNVSGVTATATVTVIPEVTKLTVTKLTSTATPSDVRDRYAVFNIKAPSAMNNYRLAVAPAATTLTAADMTAANNLGVHTYDLTTSGINVLMGFVYNAPILKIINDTPPANHAIFDDPMAVGQLALDAGGTGQSNTSYTGPVVAGAAGVGGIGMAGDIGRSLLQPGTSYTLYGLASGSSSVTSLLTFTTDTANYDVVSNRGNLAVNGPSAVDKFNDNPLSINANNYNLYPIKNYVYGKASAVNIIMNTTITIGNEGFLQINSTYGYLLFPNLLSNYTDEIVSGTTVTPASSMLYYHSMYYVEKAIRKEFLAIHLGKESITKFY